VCSHTGRMCVPSHNSDSATRLLMRSSIINVSSVQDPARHRRLPDICVQDTSQRPPLTQMQNKALGEGVTGHVRTDRDSANLGWAGQCHVVKHASAQSTVATAQPSATEVHASDLSHLAPHCEGHGVQRPHHTAAYMLIPSLTQLHGIDVQTYVLS